MGERKEEEAASFLEDIDEAMETKQITIMGGGGGEGHNLIILIC